jgi:phage tail sheath protein FI
MTGSVSIEEICSGSRSSVASAITTRDLLVSWCSTELEWAASAGCSPTVLRRQVAGHVRGYLGLLWRTGALRGEQPKDAFSVACDMPPKSEGNIRRSTLTCRVGIAPAGSSEFIFLLIQIRLQSRTVSMAAA